MLISSEVRRFPEEIVYSKAPPPSPQFVICAREIVSKYPGCLISCSNEGKCSSIPATSRRFSEGAGGGAPYCRNPYCVDRNAGKEGRFSLDNQCWSYERRQEDMPYPNY